MHEARRHLVRKGVKVLYSVGKLKHAHWLTNMVSNPKEQIWSGEIFAIDQEDDFKEVRRTLSQSRMPYAYGNGIFVANPLFWLNCRIEETVAAAAKARANAKWKYNFRMVYIWTIRYTNTMRRMLDAGVDGIFVNPPNVPELIRVMEESGRHRLATRDDTTF